jgi:hypothetical protein
VKTYWDKVGLTRDSEEKAKKYILDSTLSFPFVLAYLGGREKFLETISDKIIGKIFECEYCIGYNFKYYVNEISLDENMHYREINVNAVIDTTSLSGRTYSYEDGFTDVDYKKLSELEGSEFYSDVLQEIKAEMSDDLEKKIDAPFELYIEVETLKFETFD